MANDIGCLIIAQEFKIAMIRGQPAIQYLNGLNFIVDQSDETGRFLTPVAGITVDAYLHDRLKSFYAFQALLSAIYFGGSGIR